MDNMNLNDKLRYQDDAIVSSEIIKQSSGTVTFFAFDKGQGISEHTAPFSALIIITDGEAEVFVEGKKYLMQKDDYLLISKGLKHSLLALEKFKMILIMIK